MFISCNDDTKEGVVPIARGFQEIGFKILATGGTADALGGAGVVVERVLKLHEGRPHAGEVGSEVVSFF